MLKTDLGSVQSKQKTRYLVTCVLVLKSKDLIDFRTSMQPMYCKKNKK